MIQKINKKFDMNKQIIKNNKIYLFIKHLINNQLLKVQNKMKTMIPINKIKNMMTYQYLLC